MSATTEPLPGGARPRRGPWTPAGVAFLAVSLAALAGGAFPERLIHPDLAGGWVRLPTLQMLLAAQAGFVMLFGPLLAGLRGPRRVGGYLLSGACEYACWTLAAVPLYLAGAWLSDADAADALRGVLYLLAVAAGAGGLGVWSLSGRPAVRTAVAFAAAIAAIALPIAFYVLADIPEPPRPVEWLFSAGPVTCAYAVAEPRQGRWLPAPLWAWALWPIVGFVSLCAYLALPAGKSPAEREHLRAAG